MFDLKKQGICILVLMFCMASVSVGQNIPMFTEDFTVEEFKTRRNKVFDAIGIDEKVNSI